ncbi:Cytochrome [Smittium mucronatum]|uniref:Cytochrome n=1 Tax=Smittium mucronatum TaxID=133383 RepID=A0A1R0H0H0_9FUNG|nr:Cytochrome [Smittium mucronatum]
MRKNSPNSKDHMERPDILQMYLNSQDFKTHNKLSEKELISESLIMLMAGTDTTSVTMTMLIHMYMLYPKVYERVVCEVRAAFPDTSKQIRYSEAKSKLPYLLATVYECMRIAPIAAGLFFRDSTSGGITLSNKHIPENVEMGMFIEGANKDPTVWENPISFDPERFMGPKGDILKREIVTFSHGVRICPGRNLAWMEILTVIPNLLRDYDISIPPNSIYNPGNLDLTRNFEPKFLESKVYIVRSPTNPDRDCNIIISHRKD